MNFPAAPGRACTAEAWGSRRRRGPAGAGAPWGGSCAATGTSGGRGARRRRTRGGTAAAAGTRRS